MLMRRSIRIIAPALLAVAITSALAQERVWSVSDRAQNRIAEFGVPETDDRQFSLACELGGTVLLDPQIVREAPAEDVLLTLRIDGTDYARPAGFYLDEGIDAQRAYAELQRDDPVIDVLRRGSAMTVSLDPPTAAERPVDVSLKGSARAIDQALEDC